MGITQDDLSKVFNRIRQSIGMQVQEPDPETKKEDSQLWKMLPEWIKTPENSQRMTNVLLAMAMTKLFSPLKLAVTAMIVPPLGKKLVEKGLLRRK
jgi:hypothetical protein